MLSKLDFVCHILELKEYNEVCKKISDASNGGINLYEISDLEGTTISLLQYATRDKNDWIPYWIYELDFGKDYRPGCVKAGDGSDIQLELVDDLYDFLALEYDENGDE